MSGHATRLALSRASAPIEPCIVPPNVMAAVDLLCRSYDNLDVRFCGALLQAETDIVTALQPMPTFEVALRDMIAYLVRGVAEVRDGPAFNGNLVSLRLIHGGSDLHDILSPDGISRVTVISPQGGRGYLFDVYPSEIGAIAGYLDDMQGDRLTFIATDISEPERTAFDEAHHHLSQPHDPEMEQYRAVARLLAQIMADSANAGMDSQASLLGALSALRAAAARFVREVTQYQKKAAKVEQLPTSVGTKKISVLQQSAAPPVSLRASAMQLEKSIRQQLGNAQPSPALRQTLLTSLRQLQAARAAQTVPSQIRVVATPRPQAVMPLRGTISVPAAATKIAFLPAGIMIDRPQVITPLQQPVRGGATAVASPMRYRTVLHSLSPQLPTITGRLFAALPRMLTTAALVAAPVVMSGAHRASAAPSASAPAVIASVPQAEIAAVVGEVSRAAHHSPATVHAIAENAEPVIASVASAAQPTVPMMVTEYARPITPTVATTVGPTVTTAYATSPATHSAQVGEINGTAPQTVSASSIPVLASFAERQDYPLRGVMAPVSAMVMPDILQEKVVSAVGAAESFIVGSTNVVIDFGQAVWGQATGKIKTIWQNVTKQCCGCGGICGGATTVSGQVLNLVKRITGVDAVLGILGIGKAETRSADAGRKSLSDRINKPQPA